MEYFSVYFEITDKDDYALGKEYPSLRAIPLIYRFGNMKGYYDPMEDMIFGSDNFTYLLEHMPGDSLGVMTELLTINGMMGLVPPWSEGKMEFPTRDFKRVRRINRWKFPPRLREAIREDRERFLLNPQEGPLFLELF
jgi:hypothetical protein